MDSFIRRLYNDLFLSIRRGRTQAGLSNAKPLFLLSIIECISMCLLKENQILWNDKNLIFSYHAFAKYYEERDITPFIVPYYHLASSEFCHLLWKTTERPTFGGHTPSGKYLRENLLYSKFDDELWTLLQDTKKPKIFQNKYHQ